MPNLDGHLVDDVSPAFSNVRGLACLLRVEKTLAPNRPRLYFDFAVKNPPLT